MSVIAGSGYPISRPTGRCASTGRGLSVGERFVAALVEVEGQEGLERVDYSVEAWESGARPQLPRRLFATWRSVVPESTAKKAQFLPDEELLDLFDRLGEGGGVEEFQPETGAAGAAHGEPASPARAESKREAFRYLLTLVLIRRKLLRYEGARDGAIHVRHKPSAAVPEPPVIRVGDPKLDEAAITEAMQQLGEVMALDGSGA